jgi:hydrogenase maturation protease
MESLDTILVPGVMRSLAKMNLVREVRIADHRIDITLASTALAEGAQQWLKDKIMDAARKLEGVEEASVSFVDGKPKDVNEIRYIIAIMSGKGGVGKSLVASLTAIALKRQGYEVGILDADITGPSIPKMFGINTRPAGSDSGILPVSSRSGIEVMSINLLLPSEDDAVIWRGPLIGRAITQFWEEVLWGKLDYLIVDLPPGTADAALTVMQTLPITGIIIVFTPQDLTTMIVKKAINMAQKMDKTILGVVENMSYLYVPEIDKKIELFGKSKGEQMAKAAHAPLLGQLPIDPALAKLCDEGNIERYNAEVINQLGQSLSQAISAKAQ